MPTLLKLKTMKGADGNLLKILSRIAAGDYKTFGMCLLQDDNGVEVDLLKKTHTYDGPVGITDAIIQKWLTSSAAPTRTYQHLIECLRQSELGALAEDIANTTAGEGMSKVEHTHTCTVRLIHHVLYACTSTLYLDKLNTALELSLLLIKPYTN